MQSLWSRVAQVRGACRCPQCVPSVNGVSRRAATSATRRLPRYLTSSTLWYSGIFAVAATYDAGVKEQRRQKWDAAIAGVKEELAQPSVVRLEQEEEEELELPDEDVAERESGQLKPFFEQDNEIGVLSGGVAEEESGNFEPFFKELEEDGFRYADGQTKTDWPANTGAPKIDHRLPPNSIYAEDWLRTKLESSRWTPKKLALAQTSVDILLLELMQDLTRWDESDFAAESIPPELRSTLSLDRLDVRLDAKHLRMKVLKRAHFDMTYYTLPEAPEEELPIPTDEDAMCNYQEDDENRFRQTQRELNLSLQQLLKLYSTKEIRRPNVIGQILHRLSSSPAAPDLNTFNTLLLGFSRAEDPHSFSKILRTLRRCHQRPNETTLATVLNHFTKTDNPVGFTHWIELIRGGRGGLALARADVPIDVESGKRLIHHPEFPERIIQLPYATPMVFGAIIAGVVKFTGFEAALQICSSMGQEGWGLCMGGLTPLLDDCVRRADWSSGMAVWNQITALKDQSRRKEDSRWLSERIRLDTFATMLRLCLKCDRRDTFNEVWTLALKSHRGATEKLRALVKATGEKKRVDVVDESIVKSYYSWHMNGREMPITSEVPGQRETREEDMESIVSETAGQRERRERDMESWRRMAERERLRLESERAEREKQVEKDQEREIADQQRIRIAREQAEREADLAKEREIAKQEAMRMELELKETERAMAKQEAVRVELERRQNEKQSAMETKMAEQETMRIQWERMEREQKLEIEKEKEIAEQAQMRREWEKEARQRVIERMRRAEMSYLEFSELDDVDTPGLLDIKAHDGLPLFPQHQALFFRGNDDAVGPMSTNADLDLPGPLTIEVPSRELQASVAAYDDEPLPPGRPHFSRSDGDAVRETSQQQPSPPHAQKPPYRSVEPPLVRLHYSKNVLMEWSREEQPLFDFRRSSSMVNRYRGEQATSMGMGKAGQHMENQVTEAELLGLAPAGRELEEYEARERPAGLRE